MTYVYTREVSGYKRIKEWNYGILWFHFYVYIDNGKCDKHWMYRYQNIVIFVLYVKNG